MQVRILPTVQEVKTMNKLKRRLTRCLPSYITTAIERKQWPAEALQALFTGHTVRVVTDYTVAINTWQAPPLTIGQDTDPISPITVEEVLHLQQFFRSSTRITKEDAIRHAINISNLAPKTIYFRAKSDTIKTETRNVFTWPLRDIIKYHLCTIFHIPVDKERLHAMTYSIDTQSIWLGFPEKEEA